MYSVFLNIYTNIYFDGTKICLKILHFMIIYKIIFVVVYLFFLRQLMFRIKEQYLNKLKLKEDAIYVQVTLIKNIVVFVIVVA